MLSGERALQGFERALLCVHKLLLPIQPLVDCQGVLPEVAGEPLDHLGSPSVSHGGLILVVQHELQNDVTLLLESHATLPVLESVAPFDLGAAVLVVLVKVGRGRRRVRHEWRVAKAGSESLCHRA